jgi:hypothetical protein
VRHATGQREVIHSRETVPLSILILQRFSVCTGGTPFYVHEVIDQGGEPIKVQEYFGVGRVTEFRYGIKVRGPVLANLLRSPGIDSQPGGIDSWAT